MTKSLHYYRSRYHTGQVLRHSLPALLGSRWTTRLVIFQLQPVSPLFRRVFLSNCELTSEALLLPANFWFWLQVVEVWRSSLPLSASSTCSKSNLPVLMVWTSGAKTFGSCCCERACTTGKAYSYFPILRSVFSAFGCVPKHLQDFISSPFSHQNERKIIVVVFYLLVTRSN